MRGDDVERLRSGTRPANDAAQKPRRDRLRMIGCMIFREREGVGPHLIAQDHAHSCEECRAIVHGKKKAKRHEK